MPLETLKNEDISQECECCGAFCSTRYKLVVFDEEKDMEIPYKDDNGKQLYVCCECAA